MAYIEIRELARENVVRELFGEQWRPDRPLENLGGLVGQLLDGNTLNGEDSGIALKNTAHVIGQIKALRYALELIDSAYQKINES